MNLINRVCEDCHEKPARKGRKICCNCKMLRHIAKHPESIEKTNIRRRRNYKQNDQQRTKIQERQRNYSAGHREQEAARSFQWRSNHPERVRFLNEDWRERHRDEIPLRSKLYALENPEKIRHKNRLRKALVRGANVKTITVEAWEEQISYFNTYCAYCLKFMDIITMDHMTPITRGGLHDIDNVVPSCKQCNPKKNNKNLLEWLMYLDGQAFIVIGSPRRSDIQKLSIGQQLGVR
jgi:hypothetical protein